MIFIGSRYIGDALNDSESFEESGSSDWLVSIANRFSQLRIDRRVMA